MSDRQFGLWGVELNRLGFAGTVQYVVNIFRYIQILSIF